MYKTAVALLIFSCLLPTLSKSDPYAVPGGIVKIPVAKINQQPPQVFFEDERVSVMAGDSHWLALVGIPLSAKIGTHKITIKTATQSHQQPFSIHYKDYPEQRITMTDKRMVTGFTQQDLKKINADKAMMDVVKKIWTEQAIDTHFIVPVDGKISGLFGLKRFFNGIAKRPHNGLDIAREIGTPILAPTAAKVINTGDYYFNGNTVFLDHGQGLLTAYLHMDKINVHTGQFVKQGSILGTVGKTGRVTGPHLHWIVYLNKTPVDPMLFVSQYVSKLNNTTRLNARHNK